MSKLFLTALLALTAGGFGLNSTLAATEGAKASCCCGDECDCEECGCCDNCKNGECEGCECDGCECCEGGCCDKSDS